MTGEEDNAMVGSSGQDQQHPCGLLRKLRCCWPRVQHVRWERAYARGKCKIYNLICWFALGPPY